MFRLILIVILLLPVLTHAQEQSAHQVLVSRQLSSARQVPASGIAIGNEEQFSIQATNIDVVPWTLLLVRIDPLADARGYSEFDLIDSLGERVKLDSVRRLLLPGGNWTEPIVFHPDHLGEDSVRVTFVWDSSGLTQDSISTIVSGIGAASEVIAARDDASTVLNAGYNSGCITIRMPDGIVGEAECSVFDLLGHRVIQQSVLGTSRVQVIPGRNLPSGVYLIVLSNRSLRLGCKLIVR